MAISNYTGYYVRKYRDSKGWHTEKGKTSQFETFTSIDKSGYETVKIPTDTLVVSAGERNNVYAKYEPGKVFLSRYFTYNDLFERSYLEGFRQFILDCYNSRLDEYYAAIYSLTSDANIFFTSLDGQYIFPILKVVCGKASYKAQHIFAARYVGIGLDFMKCKYKPEEIDYVSEDSKEGYFTKKDTGETLSKGTDYYISTAPINYDAAILSYTGSNVTLVTLEQLELGIINFFESLYRIRLHINSSANTAPLNSSNYNGKYYFFSYKNACPTSSTYSQQKWGSFFVDVRNVPRYNNVGFNRLNDGITNYNIVTIKWGEGPEASDPFEEKDPNEDDPGHGPGQNPGDSGGDGNHDNTSDEIKPPNVPSLSGAGAGLFTIYNPTNSELMQLAQKLWQPDALTAILQYFTNPMDTILGLSIVPVAPRGGTRANIYLGVYDTQVTANVVDSDYVIVDCGTIPIERYWGSYLDYDPYTKISCYLPYIGEIDVNPDQVMQKNVSVKYYVNVVTGDIVAMLCADGSVIYTAAGNCIRQLPLSNNDYSAIINTAVSAVSTLAMAAATSGVGNAAIAGAQEAGKSTELLDAKQTANSVGSGGSLIHDVMNAKFHYQHAGAIGTGSGQLSYQTPYLTIERPNLDLANNYKAFVGYPCNKTMALSSCHGFTQIEATRLSISGATDAEIAEITTLLVGGVII